MGNKNPAHTDVGNKYYASPNILRNTDICSVCISPKAVARRSHLCRKNSVLVSNEAVIFVFLSLPGVLIFEVFLPHEVCENESAPAQDGKHKSRSISTKDCVPYSYVDLQLHGHCIRMTRTMRST